MQIPNASYNWCKYFYAVLKIMIFSFFFALCFTSHMTTQAIHAHPTVCNSCFFFFFLLWLTQHEQILLALVFIFQSLLPRMAVVVRDHQGGADGPALLLWWPSWWQWQWLRWCWGARAHLACFVRTTFSLHVLLLLIFHPHYQQSLHIRPTWKTNYLRFSSLFFFSPRIWGLILLQIKGCAVFIYGFIMQGAEKPAGTRSVINGFTNKLDLTLPIVCHDLFLVLCSCFDKLRRWA